MQAAWSRRKTCNPSPDARDDALAYALFKIRLVSGSMPRTGSRGTVTVNQPDEPSDAADSQFSSGTDLGIFRGYPRCGNLDNMASCASAGETPAWIVR